MKTEIVWVGSVAKRNGHTLEYNVFQKKAEAEAFALGRDPQEWSKGYVMRISREVSDAA